MIGQRLGSIGLVSGSAVGTAADDEGTSMVGVTKDATSGIYCPATAAEWATTMAAAGIGSGGPSYLWLCQEAAGNLADSIGSAALIPNAAPGYQTAIAGWSRKGVSLVEATTAQRFGVAAGVAWNAHTQSVLMLFYARVTSLPAAARILLTMDDSGGICRINVVNVSGHVRMALNGSFDGTSNMTATGIQPVVALYDRTNLRAVTYTGQDKVVATYFDLTADGGKGIGSLAAGGIVPSADFVYGGGFQSAAAELTDAQIKTLLQTLGWTIPWS